MIAIWVQRSDIHFLSNHCSGVIRQGEIVIVHQIADMGSGGCFMCSTQLATVAVVQYVPETAMQCILAHPLGAGLIICPG